MSNQDPTVAFRVRPVAATAVGPEPDHPVHQDDTRRDYAHAAAHLTAQFAGIGQAQTLRMDTDAAATLPHDLPVFQLGAQAKHERLPMLELGQTIAAGGMGTVFAARQVSLDREVAIKAPHPGQTRNAAALVGEARLAGKLQHPNIVPVYDLGTDADDRLLLVMQRLEGVTWASQLAERAVVGTAAWPDWLATQLRVLLQVCNAIDFAHARGIVHRDLKPVNVMVGRFGEVFVLDWGIACSVVDENGLPRPYPVDADRAEGTLSYMAPEQAGAVGVGVTAATDVFQLGGLLHEILTGKAPCARPTLRETAEAVWFWQAPDLEGAVGAELRDICKKALARQPADRFASACAFADAVEQWLRRWPALALLDAARKVRSELNRALVANAALHTVQGLYAQARFALQQALATWPGHAEAAQELRAITLVVVHELCRRGELGLAEALYCNLDGEDAPTAQLLADARTAQTARDGEQARLAAAGRQLDIGHGARSRRVLAWALGGIFPAVFFSAQAGLLSGLTTVTHGALIGSGLGAIAIVGGVGLSLRAQFSATVVNRTAIGVLFAMTVIAELLRVSLWALGAMPEASQICDLGLYALASASLAPVLGRPMYGVTGGFVVAAVVGTLTPQWLLGLSGIALSAAFWVGDGLARRAEQGRAPAHDREP